MLPAEITSTAAKPRMIFARNLRVGNIVRLDGDAIRPDIPTPIAFSRDQEAPRLPVRMRKATAETIRAGKFGSFEQRTPWSASGRRDDSRWHPTNGDARRPIHPCAGRGAVATALSKRSMTFA